MSYQTVGVTGFTSFNKIPEHAREYKKEYLFIRGLNKEFKYMINKLGDLNNGLFESNTVNRIKFIMKRFLRGQEKGKLKDISNLMLERKDVNNIVYINKNFGYYKIRWDFFCDSDSDSDSDDDSNRDHNHVSYSDSDSDSDSDSNRDHNHVSYSDSDSDSDSDSNRDHNHVSYSDNDDDSDLDLDLDRDCNHDSDSDSDDSDCECNHDSDSDDDSARVGGYFVDGKPYPGFKEIYDIFKKIFSQINKDCYSDDNYVDYDNYDFDFSNILPNSDSDTDSDSDDF